jgi:hypothetical protein
MHAAGTLLRSRTPRRAVGGIGATGPVGRQAGALQGLSRRLAARRAPIPAHFHPMSDSIENPASKLKLPI